MVKSNSGHGGGGVFAWPMPRSAAGPGSFAWLKQPTGRPRTPPRLQTQSQIGYPQQIVSPGHEIGPSLRSFHSAIATAPQSAHRLHPAEDFFHPFPNALTGAVTSTAGRPSVQTVHLGPILTRRVRSDLPLP